MSGPKKADVRLKLNKLVKCMNQQQKTAAKNAQIYEQMGLAETESSRNNAQKLDNSTAVLASSDVRKYASKEAEQITALASEIQAHINQGERAFSHSERLRSEAQKLKQQSNVCMERAVNIVDEAAQLVENASAYRNFIGLDTEDSMAEEGSRLVNEALECEKQMAVKLRESADQLKTARNSFDNACAKGRHVDSETRRIVSFASQQRQASEIAESQLRESTAMSQEVGSLVSRLSELNHAKFAPGEYDKLQNHVSQVQNCFKASDHASVIKSASSCLPGLRNLVESVSQLECAWESARNDATNDLESVKNELNVFDRKFLSEMTTDMSAINTAYDGLMIAQQKFEAEDFQGCCDLIAKSLKSLRDLNTQALVNKHKNDQRQIIADAIMNALYDQKYDAPQFYYSEQNKDGIDIELSDLTIFAKSPGQAGDVRMNINLDGKVKLEIENIAEGEEVRCVSIINELQQQLADDIDFDMTDWGRGASANSGEIVTPKFREVTQEKTKDRTSG